MYKGRCSAVGVYSNDEQMAIRVALSQPLRLTPYGDGLARIGFSDPISGKLSLPEMGFPTP